MKKLEYVHSLCNQGKFDEALPILEELVNAEPQNSEAWRTLAQLHWINKHMPEKAYDELIEALKCNPRNIWALVLMGNLLTKEMKDVKHAKEYYEKVLEYYPDNAIAINNIGGTYMELQDYENAIYYLEKALAIDDTYVNSYYGLGLAYYKTDKRKDAFDICIKGLQISKDRPENPQVRTELAKLLLNVAKDLVEKTNYISVWNGIKEELESIDHINIRIVEDKNLQVNARFENAIAHKATEHVIRYNPDRQFIDHLFVHEMMHLKMNQKATLSKRGKVVVFTPANYKAFKNRYIGFMRRRHKGLSQQVIEKAVHTMCEGIGTQLSSCPLDLFVEHIMYHNYEIMRPVQLLSLFHQEEVNIDAIRKGEQDGLFPSEIVRASKVMNIVTCLHFKDLYGIDLVHEYKPKKVEFEQAKDLYDEFKAYLNTYKDGDEYEMMEYFVQSFKMEDFLELRDETHLQDVTFSNKSDIDDKYDLLDEIDTRLKTSPSSEDIEVSNAQFALDHQDGADPTETMMMSMYMLGAMQEFDKLSHDKVKKIAFDIATIGINGISPQKKYTVKSIGEKEFGGYELLAYYYVSWAREFPDAVDKLQLPFTKAYEVALQMYDSKNKKQ